MPIPDPESIDGVSRSLYLSLMPKQDSTAYHYTSSSAALSIIDKGEMWVSDVKFLNDSKELDFGIQLIEDMIHNKIAEIANVNVRNGLKLLLWWSKRDIIRDYNIYVCCFSTKGDDLNQWRAYGNVNFPVAIKFNTSTLMFGNVSEGTTLNIIYRRQLQTEFISNILEIFMNTAVELNLFTDIKYDANGNYIPIPNDMVHITQTLGRLFYYISVFKSEQFESESEVRFIYKRKNLSGPHIMNRYSEEKFRDSNGRIIPYATTRYLHSIFQHPTDPPVDPDRLKTVDYKFPILSVCIGPNHDSDMIERGIRRLLDARGYDHVTITRSESSLRR